jgi:argininosuccinate lyase
MTPKFRLCALRQRMADYLGFPALVENAYDAAQISSAEEPVEAGAVVTSIALHAGNFIQDILVQYASPRPWIVLAEGGGNTYVSSAMQRILGALVVSPERALEALNSDWTASQELADLLMRKYKVPFRIGHHFASEVVSYARAHDIRPLDFPFAEARRIYAALPEAGGQLPMTEAEFRAALDPVAIVKARATRGGPQPAEMERMLGLARERIAQDDQWIAGQRKHIDQSLAKLDADFDRLLASGGRRP